MWRSARALFDAAQIETPGGLRGLIEAVYGPEAEPLPSPLERPALDAEGKERGNSAQARFNTIVLADGYGGLDDLPDDQEIGTRLGEEVRILRLARLADGVVQAWAEDPQGWARSELRVRETWLKGASEAAELKDAIAAAKADWPDWEREATGPLIGLVDAEGTVRLDGGPSGLRYDRERGLMRDT